MGGGAMTTRLTGVATDGTLANPVECDEDLRLFRRSLPCTVITLNWTLAAAHSHVLRAVCDMERGPASR